MVEGERYSTRLTIVGLEAIKPGAAQMSKIESFDSSGELVCRTWQLGISRGVEVTGSDSAIEVPPPAPAIANSDVTNAELAIPVQAGLGNIYTETAHIFNPIHSDRKFALAAGLPDIILHGTATLALAVSQLVDRYLDGDASRVTRLGGRFAGMVLMPSTLTLRIVGEAAGQVAFEVGNPDGSIAFSKGFFCFHS